MNEQKLNRSTVQGRVDYFNWHINVNHIAFFINLLCSLWLADNRILIQYLKYILPVFPKKIHYDRGIYDEYITKLRNQ